MIFHFSGLFGMSGEDLRNTLQRIETQPTSIRLLIDLLPQLLKSSMTTPCRTSVLTGQINYQEIMATENIARLARMDKPTFILFLNALKNHC